jgi:uncharacterized protein YebE (UPF0316 family)
MEFLHDHPELLAVAIFLSRIADVSLGTLRTILIFRGYRSVGALLGFFEVVIWVVAVGQVITNLDRWYLVVAYAGGFASGNWIGAWIESRLALGAEMVRAVSANPEVELAARLRAVGFDVIEVGGSTTGRAPVEVLLVVESRKRVPALIKLIRGFDPDALCTVSDVKIPARGLPPQPSRWRAIGPAFRSVVKRK